MNLKKRIFVTLPFCTFRLFYFLLMISAVSKRLKYRGSGAAKEVVAEINKKRNWSTSRRKIDLWINRTRCDIVHAIMLAYMYVHRAITRLIFVLRESAEVPRPHKQPVCILYEVICIERDHEVWPINYHVSAITATPTKDNKLQRRERFCLSSFFPFLFSSFSLSSFFL